MFVSNPPLLLTGGNQLAWDPESGSNWIRIAPHSISLLDQEPHLFIYYMCLSNLKNLQIYQKNSVVRLYHRPHFVFLFFRKYLQNSVCAYSTLMTIKSTRADSAYNKWLLRHADKQNSHLSWGNRAILQLVFICSWNA